MTGFTAGVIALMVVNYGAAVTIALPSSVIVIWSMAFVYMAQKWDKGEEYPVFGDLSKVKAKKQVQAQRFLNQSNNTKDA